jgi:hypothetical protein
LHPSDEGCNIFMRLKRRPSAVATCQFFFSERGMNFPVADAVNRMRLSAALAFGYEMMLINAFASNQTSAAERASAGPYGSIGQGCASSQGTFTHHIDKIEKTFLAQQ